MQNGDLHIFLPNESGSGTARTASPTSFGRKNMNLIRLHQSYLRFFDIKLNKSARCPQGTLPPMSYNREYFMTSVGSILKRWTFSLLFFSVLVGISGIPRFAFAETLFTATPMVIDGKGKVREILRYSVSLTNTTNHLISVYPWVNDVDDSVGETGSSDLAGSKDKDISESLSRWLEVTRASIDMLPGEHKDVPIMIQINLSAKPGHYHAKIHLSAGGDRASAEANKAGTTDIAVNIEVLEDINERVQLGTFTPDKTIFAGDEASFKYSLDNIGNRGVIPHGKIRIYDRDGQEVATFDANQAGQKIEPLGKAQLASVWASDGSFGRYKAMLDLEYGARGTIQDTVFFWVVPWKKVVGMFLSLIIFCVIIAIGLHSKAQASRDGAFAVAPIGGGRIRGVLSRFGIAGDDEGDDDDEESYAPPAQSSQRYARNVVSELREVPAPPIVRTRLYSRDIEAERGSEINTRASTRPSTRLSQRVEEVNPSNQIFLSKKVAPKAAPEHIVNLRR